jgi:diguanylate cyclase (GGDEF)-like protein/PAS domain S-box-containing protein
MKHRAKTKEQLLNELGELRQRAAELEESAIELQRAEEALQREREKFQVLVEEAPLGVSVIEKDGQYKYVNPKFTEIFGYTLEDIPTGSEWFNIAYPDKEYRKYVVSTWVNDLQKAKRGEVRPRTFTVRCKDGSEKVIYFRPVTMKSGDQFVIYENITERQQEEEKLEKHQEHLEELVEKRTAELKAINEQLQQEITERNRAEEALRSFQSDLQAKNESLKVLHAIADKVYGSLDLKTVAELAVASMMNYSQSPFVGIFALNEESRSLELLHSIGFSEEMRQRLKELPFEGSLSGITAAQKEIVTSDDILHDDRVEPSVKKGLLKQGFKGVISVPLLFQDRVLGVINLFFKGRIPPLTDLERETLMNIGKTIGLAMANARYVAQIEDEIKERIRTEDELRESESRYRTLFDSAADAIFVHDLKGGFLDANTVACDRYGYSKKEFLQMPPQDIIAPGRKKGALQRFEEIRKRGHVLYETVHLRCDGINIPTEVSSQIIEYRGSPVILSIARDITERKQAEEVLRESETRLRKLFEAIPEAVMVHDEEGTILHINDVGAKRLEWTVEDLAGRNLREIVKPENAAVISDHVRKARTDGSCSFETTYISRTGRHIVAEVNERPIELEGKGVILSVARDITERKRAEQQLAHMATHDALTGLPNRVLFNDRLTLALAQAQRNQQKLTVMLLDLDRFKDINDTLGHSVGDQLLHLVSKRLRRLLRKSDTLGRMGGDEFLFLVPGIARLDNATEVARKILESFHKPFLVEDHELHTTASIGVTIYPDDGADADTLLKNADIAMYSAKQKGRNNYQRYTSIMKTKNFE